MIRNWNEHSLYMDFSEMATDSHPQPSDIDNGVKNCILRGNTAILDILYDDGRRAKRYHRYKTLEKAEYMWKIYGVNAHMVREEEE